MDAYIHGAALFQVLLVSLIAGAGLVVLFGLGLVGVSAYTGNVAPDGGPDAATAPRRGSPTGLALAVVCFAVVLAGVALGLYTILAS